MNIWWSLYAENTWFQASVTYMWNWRFVLPHPHKKKLLWSPLPGCAKCTILMWAHGLSRKAAALTLSGMCIASTSQKRGKGNRKGWLLLPWCQRTGRTFYVSMRKNIIVCFPVTRSCSPSLCRGQGTVLSRRKWNYLLSCWFIRGTPCFMFARAGRLSSTSACTDVVQKGCNNVYTLLVLMSWYWLWIHSARMLLLPLAGQPFGT